MVTLSNQFGKPYMTKGGQGKLFSDPKPTNEHRYQAGYTPDRMAAVRDSMIDVQSGPEGHFGGPAGQHRALGVIARSKTPVREFNEAPVKVAIKRSGMQDPSGVSHDDLWPLRVNMATKSVQGSGKRGAGAAAGNYSSGGAWERGSINVGAHHHESEEHAGQSLIHELGHYKSAKVDNSGHQEWYGRDPAETGREEARADDNMVSRWRPDPRDVRHGTSNPKTPTYEWSGAFSGMGSGKAHGPYVTARKTLSPGEKKTIRTYGFRPGGRTVEPFTHDATGEHWAPTGKHTNGWHVQGNLFSGDQFGEDVRPPGNFDRRPPLKSF